MRLKYDLVKFSNTLAPVVQIGLGTPITNKGNLKKYKALIDTGYDGTVLISNTIFTELGLKAFKLPSDLTATAEFISGTKVDIKSAEGTLYLVDLELEFIINIDAMDKIHEILIGRQILEEIYLALAGTEKELVISSTKEDFKKQLCK